MRLATLNQIKKAALNVISEGTSNNDDVNYLLSQRDIIKERLADLPQPLAMSSSAWDRYEERHEDLSYRLAICEDPSLAGQPENAEKKIGKKQIQEANAMGLRYAAEGRDPDWWHTPILGNAFDLGYHKGIKIDANEVVTVERYGAVPEDGLSTNYANDTAEAGVSTTRKPDGELVGSLMWFQDRELVKFEGLLSPVTGSDGECLYYPVNHCVDYDDCESFMDL